MHEFTQQYLQVPVEKGNYLLVFQVHKKVTLKIGALGFHTFPKGNYIYAGSALGSGGIRARVKHHLTSTATPHWHMDHLKPHTRWLAVAWQVTPERLECRWTQQLISNGATAPVRGFGASDCHRGCPAHLVHLTTPVDVVLEPLAKDGQLGIMYNKTNFKTTRCT